MTPSDRVPDMHVGETLIPRSQADQGLALLQAINTLPSHKQAEGRLYRQPGEQPVKQTMPSKALPVYGVYVPAGEYTAIKRLADVLFDLTPSDSYDNEARKLTVEAAIRIRIQFRAEAESLRRRPQPRNT